MMKKMMKMKMKLEMEMEMEKRTNEASGEEVIPNKKPYMGSDVVGEKAKSCMMKEQRMRNGGQYLL